MTNRLEEFGQYSEWPTPERAAFERFLSAWWTATLSKPRDAARIDDVLSTIAGAVDDLGPFLARWRRFDLDAAVENLRAFLAWHRDALARGGLNYGWWVHEALVQVVDWVYDPDTYVAVAERAYRPDLVEVAKILEWISAQQ